MTNAITGKGKTRGVSQVTPDLDKLAKLFIDSFPQLGVDDQLLALKIYQLLAEGEAVPCARLARSLDRPVGLVVETLGQWRGVFYDESGRIEAFLGLSVKKTQHQLTLNGINVYTWCAWDTLFIPELLNASVTVSSSCGTSGEAVRLTVSPAGIESVEPADVVVSFLVPDENDLREDVTASFCHFVYFFRSREDGAAWVSGHDGSFLLSLEEAYTVGRKMNAARYNKTLFKTGSQP